MNESQKIMVVDDDLEHIELMRRVLVQAGYSEIISTSDSEQAVGLFRETLPDILLLDIAMPTLGGLPVIEQLGNRLDPMVFSFRCSSSRPMAPPEAKRKAFAAGADDLLVKPFRERRGGRPRQEPPGSKASSYRAHDLQ